MDTPKVLYHGSLYKQNELKPGIKHTGKLVVWDGVESNQNLYATTDANSAALLGIGSGAEKTFDSERFIELNGDIWLYTKTPISIDDFLEMEVYRYTIPFRDADRWTKNNNPRNNIDTEWITRNTIRGIKCERLNIRDIMRGHSVTNTQAPSDVMPHELAAKYASETKVYKL